MTEAAAQLRIEKFFSSERKRLSGFVRGLIQDSAERDSDDIVQDVMASVFSVADLESTVRNLSAFVYQSLRNRVIDVMRRRKKNISIDAELPGDTGLFMSDLLGDVRYGAADGAHRKEIQNDITRATDELDESSREIIIATEIEECSFKDLSVEWDEPIGTLLARKSRAMKKVRETLIAYDKEFYTPLLQKEEAPYGP